MTKFGVLLRSTKTVVRESFNDSIFFTDEKLFAVAAMTNSQNDRFYVCPRVPTRKKNVNENRLLRTRSTFSKSVGGCSTDGWRTRSLIVINSSVICNNLEQLCLTGWWHRLDNVENVYVAYNLSHFAIFLPTCIKLMEI